MQLEYTIAEGPDKEIFLARVNYLLEKGWSLQGGVCTLSHGYGRSTLYQALTRQLPLKI